MTRPHPLAGDGALCERPAHAPLWEETLEDGDLLYIPRGCWHVAAPLAEPTLHLTVGVHNRTGIDLLKWVAEKMRAREVFRKDLARFASREELGAHVSRLREELLSGWDAEVLEGFFDDFDASAEPRAHAGLPWSATSDVLPPTRHALVRLIAPRPLRLKIEDGVVFFALRSGRLAEECSSCCGPGRAAHMFRRGVVRSGARETRRADRSCLSPRVDTARPSCHR